MSHAKYVMLLEKKLFLAPIQQNPQRVLDLGTGTGTPGIASQPQPADVQFRNLGDKRGRSIPISRGILINLCLVLINSKFYHHRSWELT
jgi:hypothetical protein